MNTQFSRTKFTVFGLFCLCCLGSAPSTSYAADKALLIGVGSYKNPQFNLTGINLDIDTINNFARSVGYQSDNIKALLDEQVSRENIKQAFSGFLSEGVTENDNILIYYSGHGVQITDKDNDEQDGRDEALTLHSLGLIPGSYSGIITDDELAALLNSLPSKKVTIIVDACHSGTVTRSMTQSLDLQSKAYGQTRFQPKALPYRGSRSLSRSIGTKDVSIDSSLAGVVTLSAAQDDEQALATERGSTFTLALSEALQMWGSDASINTIMSTASEIINQRVDKKHVFRPNLTGDKSRFEQAIRVDNSNRVQQINWLDAKTMASRLKPIDVQLNQADFVEDDLLNLQLNIPTSGYLNVLGIDSDDALILLYPNKFDANNYVQAGTLQLPGAHDFEWRAQAPWGNNLLVAIFSEQKVNLYQSSLQKNLQGDNTSDYALPDVSTLISMGFGDEAPSVQGLQGTALEFSTCSTQSTCP